MKIFIVSHISDPDGITPIILAKLVFRHVDYLLVESNAVNNEVLNLINNKTLFNYDAIFITDLGLNKELSDIIANDKELRQKVKLFDHHIGNYFQNQYCFAKIVDIDEDGIKHSGTSLFYQYLLKNYRNLIIQKESVRHFVDLVRQYDTWEWVKTNNIDAKRLANLFDIYGRDCFLNHYLNFLKNNDEFAFDNKELFLLEVEQNKINKYIDEKKEKVFPVQIKEYKAGIVFASLYRSELGSELAKHYKDTYDFIIIINIERSISYRGIKDIDLNEIAKLFGGKGHFNSSGSPLPTDLNKNLIHAIFNDKAIIIDNK